MQVKSLDETAIYDIGHAFGYYDDGVEPGLVSMFPNRDAAAAYICGYVRMTRTPYTISATPSATTITAMSMALSTRLRAVRPW